MRRTSRLRPSCSTTLNVVWLPSPVSAPSTSVRSKRAGPSSSATPSSNSDDPAPGPANPHEILTIDLARRVHQAVSELAIGREQQQPGGVDVQPADSDPSALAGLRQPLEYCRPPLRVGGGLSPRRRACSRAESRRPPGRPEVELPAVEPHLVGGAGPVAELCGAPAHGYPALADPVLDRPARAKPRAASSFCSLVMRSYDKVLQDPEAALLRLTAQGRRAS